MTRESFIQAYAARSNMTPQELEAHGMKAYPCHCDADNCEGWQMVSEESARTQVDLGFLSEEEFQQGGML